MYTGFWWGNLRERDCNRPGPVVQISDKATKKARRYTGRRAVASLYIEREEVQFVWCAHVHLPGYMDETAELSFPHDLILMFLRCQLWTGVH